MVTPGAIVDRKNQTRYHLVHLKVDLDQRHQRSNEEIQQLKQVPRPKK